MNESKLVSKTINSYLNRKEIREQLFKGAVSVNQVKDNIGEILKYYVLTRDTDTTLDLKDVVGRSRAIQSGGNGYYKGDKFVEYSYDKDFVKENASSNGFVTHSFNSYIKNKVKRSGLRNGKTKDEKLSKDLEFLESKVGKSQYLENQQASNPNEIYIAAPGQASVHYATNMNPERLYLGPLSQERESALPIRVGESKKDYLMRVAHKKAIENCSPEDYDSVMKAYSRVIEKLANDTACIALIPMKSSRYDLKVAYSAGNPEDRKYTSPEVYYSPMAHTGLFLSNDFGNCGQLNDGVTVGDTIPGSEIGIIDVLDEFTMKQILAREKGLKEGEYIDYFSGEKVSDYREENASSNQMIKYSRNIFKRMFQKVKDRFSKKQDIVAENNVSDIESSSSKPLDKAGVKGILMSMRTPENEAKVNNLLGKIDLMDEAAFAAALEQVGNSEEGVKKLFEDKLAEREENRDEEKFPINDMFTYGISGNCVHLHLPGDLHNMMKEKGMKGTLDTVNLSLLDAINRVAQLKKDGFYKFKGIDSIYMISPILIEREMRFLSEMDFETTSYKKSDLRDPEFIENHPEAKLARHIFGEDRNVGTAVIKIDTVLSDAWQDKKNQKVQEFAENGITLKEDNTTGEFNN